MLRDMGSDASSTQVRRETRLEDFLKKPKCDFIVSGGYIGDFISLSPWAFNPLLLSSIRDPGSGKGESIAVEFFAALLFPFCAWPWPVRLAGWPAHRSCLSL